MNAEPRSTIPMSMSESGMCSSVPNAANAGGKQTNSMTTTTMSQTWLASQIGPMACAMRSRCCCRRGPEASRSHTPPPKSAPANSTYAFSATTMIQAATSGSVRLIRQGSSRRCAGDLLTQEVDDDRSQEQVQEREYQKRHHEPGHRGDGVGGSKHAIDDPGLSSYFRYRPAGLDGEKAHWGDECQCAEQVTVVGDRVDRPATPPVPERPHAHQRHDRA